MIFSSIDGFQCFSISLSQTLNSDVINKLWRRKRCRAVSENQDVFLENNLQRKIITVKKVGIV